MLKALVAPFVGAYMAIGGLFLALFYVLKFTLTHVVPSTIFATTIARMLSEKCDANQECKMQPKEELCSHCGKAIFSLLLFAAIFAICATLFFGGKPEDISWWQDWISFSLYGLLATNMLSLFYELGREKMNGKPEEVSVEAKEEKPGTGPNFDSEEMKDCMQDKIEAVKIDQFTHEKASELMRELEELVYSRKISFRHARFLADMIENGLKNRVVPADS